MKTFLSKNWLKRARGFFPYFFVACIFLFTRVPYISQNVIPFSFDHGKDSVAILHMIRTMSPKLIGPWTSIPGVFFGSGWYYLLAPAYAISNGNPVSAIVTMQILVLIQIFILWKYFGKTEAVILGSAPSWIIMSKSAWNPFPMSLITILFFLFLRRIDAYPQKRMNYFLLAFIASMGFHFSAAFAIFYLAFLPIFLFFRKKMLDAQKIGAVILGFFIPFIPQLLFEVRHDFLQTRSVVAYFSSTSKDAFSLSRSLDVFRQITGELKLAVFPELFSRFDVQIMLYTKLLFVFIFIGAMLSILRTRIVPSYWREYAIFLFLPIFGYFFLHFNVWYVISLLPVVVFLVADMIRTLPWFFYGVYLVLMITTPIAHLHQYQKIEKYRLYESQEMLPVKLRAIEWIRERAGTLRYRSFHYVPDIYDYSYQYIYLWQAMQGKPLPVEFSYKPNETVYIPEKEELLRTLPQQQGTPERVFFIIEKPGVQRFFDEWWGQQRYSRILSEVQISPDIKVIEASSIESVLW